MTTPLPVVNTQPPEKPDLRDDGSLDIVETFDTLQGEGPFAGRPAVFIRLAGCNLCCGGCDTQYTQGRGIMTVPEILREVELQRGAADLVVITGGEPFRQNLGGLVDSLISKLKCDVQIETNGTLYPTMDAGFLFGPELTVVCSPKSSTVSSRLVYKIDAWKYVMEAGHVDPDDGLPTSVLGEPIRPARPPKDFPRDQIYVQPMDTGDVERNAVNAQAAVASCLKFGFRFGLQIHKLVNLP